VLFRLIIATCFGGMVYALLSAKAERFEIETELEKEASESTSIIPLFFVDKISHFLFSRLVFNQKPFLLLKIVLILVS